MLGFAPVKATCRSSAPAQQLPCFWCASQRRFVVTFVNEGLWDRLIRLFIGLVLGYAAWMAWPGTAAMVYLAIGTIAFVTGIVGWCPAYALFHLSTKKAVKV
jgi:hypothetical protein